MLPPNTPYVGPATLFLTREEWSVVVLNLQLIPSDENEELSRRIEAFLAKLP